MDPPPCGDVEFVGVFHSDEDHLVLGHRGDALQKFEYTDGDEENRSTHRGSFCHTLLDQQFLGHARPFLGTVLRGLCSCHSSRA